MCDEDLRQNMFKSKATFEKLKSICNESLLFNVRKRELNVIPKLYYSIAVNLGMLECDNQSYNARLQWILECDNQSCTTVLQ